MINKTIKKRLWDFAVFSFLFFAACLPFATSLRAQTYVTAPMTGTPVAGSYYNGSSITLSPNFSFAAATGSSLNLYITGCIPQTLTLSANQNYILTSIPRVGGMKSVGTTINSGDFANRSTCELMQTVQYFDGLGGPLQTIQVKGSPADKDVVQPVAYDQFGRETVKYLPYVGSASAGGAYQPTALSGTSGYSNSQQYAFYQVTGQGYVNTTTPLAVTNFEPSPLNRLLEQGAPGTSWQPAAGNTSGHTVKMEYTTNNEIAIGTTASTMIAVLYNAVINTDQTHTLTIGNAEGNYYKAGRLYVIKTYDENWQSGRGNTTEEYKDKNGHVVLKRTFNTEGGVLKLLSTYYVYDDLGNLTFVLPPMSGADGGITSAANKPTLDNFCYQYNYDQRNRLTEKKLPGKDWEYMVYNKLDQVIATQDGLQRAKAPQEWTFTKYDAMGRQAYWGVYQYPSSTKDISYRPTLQSTADGQGTLWESQQATGTGYSGGAWPQANILRYLQINFYDNYNFPNKPYTPSISGTLTNPTGLPTASMTSVLLPDGTYGSMLWSVNYYDAKGRPAQVLKQHYLGGEAALNNNNYDEINTIYNDFTSEVTQTIRHHYVAGAQVLWAVTGYTYDHMGRKLRTTEAIANGTAALPSATVLSQMDYNDMGQVKTKHLHSAPGATTFMQDIGYTYNERGWLKQSSAPLFAMQLKYDDGTTPQYNGNIANQLWGTPANLNKSYTYSYDQLNRLTAGVSNEGYSEQNIDYDLNGNIMHLTRQANPAYVYSYNGNQLQSVSGLTSGTYTYDVNGNATFDARNGKAISYNLLNLPRNITATGFNLAYTYDIAGQKLRKSNGTTTTDYINGIQYENGTISFIQTEEGRALKSGSSYIYEYALADHLGNTRLSFDQNSATAIKQQDDYYPFGMEISRGSIVSPKNEYLYNKKELQEELGGIYDYGARFYDPVIARWGSVDPLAEQGRRWSPYTYVFNDPMRFVDPDGMWGDYYDQQGQKQGTDNINDHKMYVVTKQADLDKLKEKKGVIKQGDVSAELLPNYDVRQAMGKSVADTRNPNLAVGDPKGDHHEEGGTAGMASDGQMHVVRAAPGEGDPNMTKDGVSVKSTSPANPSSVPDGYVPSLTFHDHPAGKKFNVKTGVTRSYHQSASASDMRNDRTRTSNFTRNYVLGVGNHTVYIYDHSGTQVATFPLNSFVFTKP